MRCEIIPWVFAPLHTTSVTPDLFRGPALGKRCGSRLRGLNPLHPGPRNKSGVTKWGVGFQAMSGLTMSVSTASNHP